MQQSIVKKIISDIWLLKNISLPFENLHYLCRTGDSRYPIPYPSNEKNKEVIIVRNSLFFFNFEIS